MSDAGRVAREEAVLRKSAPRLWFAIIHYFKTLADKYKQPKGLCKSNCVFLKPRQIALRNLCHI
jgi:hypothetical protein